MIIDNDRIYMLGDGKIAWHMVSDRKIGKDLNLYRAITAFLSRPFVNLVGKMLNKKPNLGKT